MIGKYLKAGLALIIVLSIVTYVAIQKGPHSFVFAWTLNFMLMLGVFFFTNMFKLSLASKYYDAKPWEAKGAIYKWFGVNLFRKILVWIGWEKVIRASNPVKNNLDAIKHLEYGTRQSEFGHLVIFFIVLATNLFVAIYYGIVYSLPLLFLNIILNAYPVILQRYNRPRMQRAMRIRETIR